MHNSLHVLNAVAVVQQVSFPALLQSLLDEHQKSRPELFAYLIQHNYWMTQTALYKYFNPSETGSRIPLDPRFIGLFAAFLGLSAEQTEALLFIWATKRSRRTPSWQQRQAG